MSKSPIEDLLPPCPERSLFLNRPIDRDLFNRLFPQICKLRDESAEPIYLYLDSLGGSVYYTERLHELLKAPRHDGSTCQLVSIVPQIAASAAADLAIIGDFSAIHPNGILHCHGTRTGSNELTVDNLPDFEENLRGTNQHHALKLAQHIFGRVSFQASMSGYVETPDEPELVTSPVGQDEFLTQNNQLASFFKKLLETDPDQSPKLSQEGRDFVVRVLDRWQKKSDLFALINSKSTDKIKNEELLRDLLEENIKKDSGIRNTAKSVLNDAILVDELISSFPGSNSESLVREHGIFYLSNDEYISYQNITLEAEREEFLERVTGRRILVSWVFVMNLCQTLHEAENKFKSIDAFHLGLVDEIYGMTDVFPSFRSIANKPESHNS